MIFGNSLLNELATLCTVIIQHPKMIENLNFFHIFNPFNEYSCAVTPQVRQTGNRLSGLAGTAYASLLT